MSWFGASRTEAGAAIDCFASPRRALEIQMRDPARIDDLMETLRTVWGKNPDLRLGQLVVIATSPETPNLEVFNIEDDKLLLGLQRYAANATRSSSEGA